MLKYDFTKPGVNAFMGDVINDITAELDKENGDFEQYDFVVTCENRSIRVPCDAEIYEGLCEWLEMALEVTKE